MKFNSSPIFCDSVSSFQDTLVNVFLNEVKHYLTHQDSVNLAISGGSTPLFLFDKIVENHISDIDWSRLSIYWVDERCVSPDDDESNFGNAKARLLDYIPEVKSYRMEGEIDPGVAASTYQKLIHENLEISDLFPQFDIMLLGMGDDGHTASLFPETDVLGEFDKSVSHVWVEKKKVFRITLTIPVINNSKTKILAFKGSEKVQLFDSMGNSNQMEYPVQMIDFNSKKNFIVIGEK